MARHLVNRRTRLLWWFKYFRLRSARRYLLNKAQREMANGCTYVETTITDKGVEIFYGARRIGND